MEKKVEEKKLPSFPTINQLIKDKNINFDDTDNTKKYHQSFRKYNQVRMSFNIDGNDFRAAFVNIKSCAFWLKLKYEKPKLVNKALTVL